MVRIDEIRKALLAKEQHEEEVREWAGRLAHDIGDGFRQYLGLPNSYPTFDGPNKRYVEYFKIDHETEAIGSEPTQISGSLLISYDGKVRFGLGIVVDRAENSFPKKRFLFLIKCQKIPKKLSVSIGDRPSLECHAAKDESFDLTPIFEALYGIVMSHLNSRVGENVYGPQIGFDLRTV